MRYKPKSVAALHIVLGGLPDNMRVEAEPNVGVSAKTVGQLRKVAAWPENLAIAVPQERFAGSVVMVSKVPPASHRRRPQDRTSAHSRPGRGFVGGERQGRREGRQHTGGIAAQTKEKRQRGEEHADIEQGGGCI